ncbi:MAG TPA: ABC transporter permease [Solirubrobacteraceae bacterium]
MRLSSIVHLYRVRLKARIVLGQELAAVLGLAVGVALLFASQVASASLNGSVQQLAQGIVGHSQYQLAARDPRGFDQRLLGEVQRLPGVSAAFSVLEERVGVVGPAGQRAVDLIAGDPGSVRAAGPLLQHFRYAVLAHQRALALPAPVARAIGASPLQPIKLQVGAGVVPALLAATLGGSDIGGLVGSPVALAPLAYAQQLTGMRGRITRVFVRARRGQGSEVRTGLMRLAGDRLNVEPADFDATLFSQAAEPINQSTETFAAICALVGFMFAYCAMLFTMPLRERLIRGLRRNGATRLDTVKTLLFDALVLGTLACIVGLALGEAISLAVFHADAGYLSIGFPIGSQRIVTWENVAIAVGGGMLAACLGVLTPVREISSRSRRQISSSPKHLPRGRRIVVLAAAAACLGVTTIILFAAPQAAILAVATLIGALLLLLAPLLDLVVGVFERLQRSWDGGWSRLAVVELRSPRTRTRSLAIAATGAVAVFGSVTIQGSHTNLQRGLDRLVHQLSATAEVWVTAPGTQNLLATTPFANDAAATLARVHGVQAVGLYRAGFLDYGNRRIWVLAPPSSAINPIPPSQLVAGRLASASARLRAGGWAVLSQAIAAQHHLHIGQRFTLPAPDPRVFRVAALTTNLGWPPGAIILNPGDYARAWGSADPSAYNLTLRAGVSAEQGSREVRRALGAGSALVVQSARQREALQQTASRQGLGRLTQISLLVLIAGVLAMATAMGTLVSQRRRRFARMKVQGYCTSVLWSALLCESALLLGSGCLAGALFGIYGQLLLSHALLSVTGFPVVFSAGALAAAGSFLLVTAVAAAIVAIPGYRAAAVTPYV